MWWRYTLIWTPSAFGLPDWYLTYSQNHYCTKLNIISQNNKGIHFSANYWPFEQFCIGSASCSNNDCLYSTVMWWTHVSSFNTYRCYLDVHYIFNHQGLYDHWRISLLFSYFVPLVKDIILSSIGHTLIKIL